MIDVTGEVGKILDIDVRLAAMEAGYRRLGIPTYRDVDHRLDAVEGKPLAKPEPDSDRFDARLEASEARTDTKFADLRGEFAALRGELAAINGSVATARSELREEIVTTRAENSQANASLRVEVAQLLADAKQASGEMRGELQGLRAVVDSKPGRLDIWGAALAVAALLMAVLAFGSDRLAVGISLADKRQEQLQRDAVQDNAVKEIGNKIDALRPAAVPIGVPPKQGG